MFGARRGQHRLSSELAFQLDREGERGFGFQVRPFEIRCGSAEGPDALLGGSFAIFEIAAVDAGGAAEAVGVQPLDILLVLLLSLSPTLRLSVLLSRPSPSLSGSFVAGQFHSSDHQSGWWEQEVAGKSVRGASPEELVKSLESARQGQPWRVMRVALPAGATEDGERMKVVLRAYQECAATLVQSRWRARIQALRIPRAAMSLYGDPPPSTENRRESQLERRKSGLHQRDNHHGP